MSARDRMTRRTAPGVTGAGFVTALVALLWLLAAPLAAQDGRATVRVDGRPVFRVGATDTIAAADRAARIERRVMTLLETPRALAPAQVQPIVVGETEGSVERIELRATHIRTYGGRLVLVPNAEVFTSRITNNTASPVRRAGVSLYLGYDVDLRRASDAARQATLGTAGVLQDPAPSVRVQELGPDDIGIEIRFWADSRRSDFVATQSAVRSALVDALRQADIPLPDPDVRHIVHRDRDDQRTGRDATGESRADGP